MMEPDDNSFRKQLKEGLQQAEDQLSPKVLRGLQQARRKAVESAASKPVHRHTLAWASGFASIALVAVLVIQTGGPGLQESMLEDMAMLAAEEELELYQELEFYDWLAEREAHG